GGPGPLDGERRGPRDVTPEDRGPRAAGPVGLRPPVLGDREALEVLGEVLDHVVALGLPVDEDVQAQVLLEPYDARDLLAHRGRVLLGAQLAAAVRGPRTADLDGLREGADRRRRQGREVEDLGLRGRTLGKGGAAAVRVGERGDAVADVRPPHARVLEAAATAVRGGREGALRGVTALGEGRREREDLL